MLEGFKLFMIVTLLACILASFTILILKGHYIAGFFVFTLLFCVKYSHDGRLESNLITQDTKIKE